MFIFISISIPGGDGEKNWQADFFKWVETNHQLGYYVLMIVITKRSIVWNIVGVGKYSRKN